MHNQRLNTEGDVADDQQILDTEEDQGAFSFGAHHQSKFEDGRLTQVYFKRFLRFEQCCALFNLVAMLQSVIMYDMIHNQQNIPIKVLVERTILVSTILLIILTLFRYKCQLVWLQYRGTLAKSYDFVSSGYLGWYLSECCLLIIIPYEWFNGIKIHFFNEVQNAYSFYYLNEICCLMMLTKIIFLVRCILVSTEWFGNRAQRVCSFYALDCDYLFVVKSLMRTVPYTIIFISMFSMIFFFGYAIRICESPLNRNDITVNYFYSYNNSLWYVVQTMSTLGYGDFYARTYLGRFVIVWVCILGIFDVSVLVWTLTISLMTNKFESKAMTVLDRLMLRKDMINQAAYLLTIVAKIGIGLRRGTMNATQHHNYLVKFHHIGKQFRVTVRNYKRLQDTGSVQEEINREFYLLKEEFKQIAAKQATILNNSQRIFNATKKYD